MAWESKYLGTLRGHDRTRLGRCPHTDWLAAILSLLFLATASAQEPRIQIQTTPPPYYAHDTVTVELHITGLTEEEQPTVRLINDPPEGLTVQHITTEVGQRFQSIRNINGRIERTLSVTWVARYELRSSTENTYALGPFEVTQGNRKATTQLETFTFREVEVDDNMLVELRVADRPFYIGERIPAKLIWGYIPPADIGGLEISLPLLNMIEVRSTSPDTDSDTRLLVRTAKGVAKLPASRSTETIDGRTYQVYSTNLELLANKSGIIDSPGPVAVITKVLQRNRDPFNVFDSLPGLSARGRPTRAVRLKQVSEPIRLDIRPLPIANRPTSFAGTVGGGYSIDTEASRTVVRVGEPIVLTITVRGEQLDALRLPDLKKLEPFTPDRFHIASSDVPGEIGEGGARKQFRISLRVQDQTVNEIPGVAYSWFDPELQEYVTATSRPIALNVRPAEVISANSVISGSAPDEPVPDESTSPAAAAEQDVPRLASRLQAADLSMVEDPRELLSDSRYVSLPGMVTSGAYILSGLLVVAAVIDRSRRRMDPAERERRSQFSQLRRKILQLRGRPAREAAQTASQALHQLSASTQEPYRTQLDSMLAEVDQLVFNPQASTTTFPEDLHRRMMDWLDQVSRAG